MNSNFAVQELYNIKERNYDWESFKYQLPRKYTHDQKSNVRSGSMFCNKKNYLDQLQKDKKKIPGPSHYKFSTNCLRPQSGKMDRSKRMTISQQINQRSKKQNIPGPGSYFKRSQKAFTNQYVSQQKILIEKNHYLNQVQYLASITPGVGSYNLINQQYIQGPKLFKRVQSSRNKSKKQNAQAKIIDTAAKTIGTFEWMKNQQKKSNSNFFTKTKRFITQSKANNNLSPNTYNLDNNWLSKTNLTKLTGCSSMKSVYYN